METRLLITAFVCLIGCEFASAQIQLDRFYPPVISIGQETLIQAEGTFPKWPVSFFCDRDDVHITAAEESGKLKVVLPQSSGPGVTWIRFYDETSASKLIPLLIEPIPTKAEVEPNNKISEATSVESTGVVYGKLEKNGDIDTFRMNAMQGETLVVSAIGNRLLRSPMDMVLQLVDKRGNVLAQVDDVCGIDPQLSYVIAEDEEVFARVFAFPETPNSTISYAGAPSFVYELQVTNDTFVDHAMPLVAASNQSELSLFGWNLPPKQVVTYRTSTSITPKSVYSQGDLGWQYQKTGPENSIGVTESADESTAHANSIPFIFSGHISKPGEIDRVRFHCKKETKYRATVHSRAFGLSLDSVLVVTKLSDSKELARNDDQERDSADAAIEFAANDEGEYELSVSDLVDGYGLRHAYSVVVEESRPVVELLITDDHFSMKAGESLDIPVSIQRKYGFDKKLKVFVENFPDKIKAEFIVSEPKGDSSKNVTLKLQSEKETTFSGKLRIVGQPLDSDDKPIAPTITAIHRINRLSELHDIWLTVVPTP